MKDAEFLDTSTDRGAIAETCRFLERASHKLQLMSVRKKMTVTEMQAQVGILKKWLSDLEKLVSGKPAKPVDKKK